MQVNAEFGSREAAEPEAAKYAAYIGKIPTLLRVNIETAWIHRGAEDFGGGNSNILIYTDRGEQWENGDYIPGGPGNYVEEALLHEGVHTSLDETHAAAPGWLTAQAADPTFISTYAQDHPAREDLAESFVPGDGAHGRHDQHCDSQSDWLLRHGAGGIVVPGSGARLPVSGPGLERRRCSTHAEPQASNVSAHPSALTP